MSDARQKLEDGIRELRQAADGLCRNAQSLIDERHPFDESDWGDIHAMLDELAGRRRSGKTNKATDEIVQAFRNLIGGTSQENKARTADLTKNREALAQKLDVLLTLVEAYKLDDTAGPAPPASATPQRARL